MSGEAGRSFEVVVVGAGQAGLAISYFLKQQGRRFAILDQPIRSAWPGVPGGTR
jgi:cation diffusion facilitator CzcD-associated flavoprotein CzcO